MAIPAAGAQGLTAEQAAIMALQTQTRQAHEALRAAHDALNLAAQNSLAEKDQLIKNTEDRLRALIFRQGFDLLDAKG